MWARVGLTVAGAHDFGEVMIEAHALFGGFTDERGVFAMGKAEQDASIRLACGWARFAAVADGAFGDVEFTPFNGGAVGFELFGETAHGCWSCG